MSRVTKAFVEPPNILPPQEQKESQNFPEIVEILGGVTQKFGHCRNVE
jgi:hypothetical protein